MRTGRVLSWRRGGILLGSGITGLIITAGLWERGFSYPVCGTLLIAFLLLASIGAPILGSAMYQVTLREILKRRSLRVRVSAEIVSSKRRGRGWYVYAKCISPVTCEEIWISSPLLMDDPKPFFGEGVEVLFDPKYEARYYMMVEDLVK